MYKNDLALDSLQCLKCHKTKLNQTEHYCGQVETCFFMVHRLTWTHQ